jgi:anti-anti-sigma factor
MAVQEQLQIELVPEDERLLVRLSGELDLASAPLLQSALESAEVESARMIVLGLEGLKFIDSTGLRVLLSAHETSRERGQEFAITRATPQVQRLLSITRVDEHLRMIPE